MPSLIEIRSRIKATKNTKKITKAMQLVAASKMKTFQKTADSVKDYTKNLLGSLRLTGKTLNDTTFAEVRSEGKTLFLILTSDKGLCGAMNQRLIRTLFRSDDWNNTPADERLLMTVGRKSREASQTMGYQVEAAFDGLKEKMETVDALAVIDAIMQKWKSGEVKRVVLISPEYVNPFIFNTQLRDYLPLTSEKVEDMLDIEADHRDKPEAAFFEPSVESAVERVAERVVESLFIEAFFELKATEYSSRMIAMKKATEAADDRIGNLTNELNRARQDAITRQLSELASANEAMSTEHAYETIEV